MTSCKLGLFLINIKEHPRKNHIPLSSEASSCEWSILAKKISLNPRSETFPDQRGLEFCLHV